MNKLLKALIATAVIAVAIPISATHAFAQKVLLLHADEEVLAEDVKSKLAGTGGFSQIDVIDFDSNADPTALTLATLMEYDAVLTWSDDCYADVGALGDVLADYSDQGGGVVQASFSFYDDCHGLDGRWQTGGYQVFTEGQVAVGMPLTLVADQPGHPLLAGITNFSGGTGSFHNTPLLLQAGATLVASWSNGQPLVATRGGLVNGLIVGLNMFPPSSDADPGFLGFWDATTDGAQLMANALHYVVLPGISVTLSGPPSVLPGGTETYEFSVTDPDAGATFTVTTLSCGVNGTQVGPTITTTTGGNFQCSFTDSPTVVSVQVTNSLGAESNLATLDVMVPDGTAPQLVMPPNAIVEATSPAGAAHTFVVTATDNVDLLVDLVCSPQSGDTFPVGLDGAPFTTTVYCTATDIAGNYASDSFTVTVSDTKPPELTVPDGVTASAVGPAGAGVTFSTTAVDASAVTTACLPASGSTFPLGATRVTCAATDAAGNATVKSFDVTVTNSSTPGRMHGGGHLPSGPFRHDFNFSIREFADGTARGWFRLQVCQPERRRGRHGDDENELDRRRDGEEDENGESHDLEKHDDDDQGRCMGRRNRFAAQTFASTHFSNDPSFVPGPGHTNAVDTVVFSGVGVWNGAPGHRYEVRTTDQGERGQNRDTFRVTITAPGGAVVASSNSKLASGNVQAGPWGIWHWAATKPDKHNSRR
jgi:hypothetical protein